MFSIKSKKAGFVAVIVAIIAAIVVAVAGAGGAVAGALLTGHDIKDGSLTSADVKNGSLKGSDVKDGTILLRDLSPGTRDYIRSQAGKAGTNGTNGSNGSNGTNGQDGAPGSAAGVQKDWAAKDGSSIVDAHNVTLSNVGTPAGASVEIQNLNLPVQAGKVLTFTYKLAGGAAYSAGSPRVFLEITGNYVNTFDGNPSDAGVDNGDGTFTKSFTIPQNGRVGAAGIVVDNGVGSVTVSNLTIDGQVLSFK